MRLIDADSYAYPGDLINEPTIDAAPVVRCKTCKYCNPFGECSHPMLCSDDSQSFLQVSGDDFCSFGERKMNDA